MSRSWLAMKTVMVLCSACALLVMDPAIRAPAQPQVVTLEDFGMSDEQGFPVGWEAQRSLSTARKSYKIETEEEGAFLSAGGATQRVFKKMGWDPKATPFVTWKWRLKKVPPSGTEPIAAVFVSLDTDLLVIPVATKYPWSMKRAEGTTIEGGLFSASEIVIRSGPTPVGEWVTERVNAYEDFERLHQHEPAEQAWGISLLAGPEVEIDFGPIAVSAK